MADNLTVKLGADTSEFRGQIQAAAASVGNSLGTSAGADAGGRFITAFEHKVFGARHLSAALATALGLNFENIAQNVARFITGVSKEEEENLKRLAALSDKLTDITKKNMQDRLSDEDLLKAKTEERASLLKKLASEEGKTTESQANAEELQIQIQEKEIEMRKLSNSIRDKGFAEDIKWLHVVEEIKKEDAKREQEELKKQGEEDVAWYKKHVAQEKELHDLKLRALPPEERVVQLGQERLQLEQKIAKEKQRGGDTLSDEIQLAKIDAQIRGDTLLIEKDITKEKLAQEKAAMTASGDLGVAKAIGGFATYNTPEQQQAYEKQLIESARADTQQEIASLQNQIDAYTKSGSALGRYEIPALQQRVQALKGREAHIQDFVFNPNYQDKAGQGLFAQQVATIGDPMKLQKEQKDVLQQVAVGVSDLNTRLHNAGFTTGK